MNWTSSSEWANGPALCVCQTCVLNSRRGYASLRRSIAPLRVKFEHADHFGEPHGVIT
jgi:hypothetical protein